MSDFFSADGWLMKIIYKTGEILIVGVLWLIGCVPLLTIGASSAAAYYAIMKSVRNDRGYVWSEFFRAYKRNLKQGLITSVWMLLIAGTALVTYSWYVNDSYDPGKTWRIVCGIVVVVSLLILTYIHAVMSRFDMRFSAVCAMAFVMSIRFWYCTVLIWAMLAGVILLQYLILNVSFLLIVPGFCWFLASFPMEWALKHYMPEKTDEDEWYATKKKQAENKDDTEKND